MKNSTIIIALYIICFAFSSCKKEANVVKTVPISAITVVNAVVNANPFITDFFNTKPISVYYKTTPQISFGASQEFSELSGALPLTIYQISDTTKAVCKKILNLQGAGMYSLFLSGTDPMSPDVILSEDHPPYHPISDSTSGIRFVNLSPGSNPISVNVQGTANGSSVNSLAYKTITGFMNFPVTGSITQYTFEIRDVATGDLLTTFTYYGTPFQNITICVIGQEGVSAAVPISAVQENNF